MIKWAFEAYVAISILSPWLFFFLRRFGIYNFSGYNTLIFLALFGYSGFILWKLWEKK